jgi:asparagine synthase (glutamine-hydrolysing)
MQQDTWLVIAPDNESGAAATAALISSARRVIPHASGRPWLLGCWPGDEVLVAVAGAARIAVIGHCSVTATDLMELVSKMRRVEDVDSLAGRLSGCFHLVTSFGGQVRAQGSVAQVRRIFYTRIGNSTLAADRADVLARSACADVDEAVLAARLMFPSIPPPLDSRSLWRDVHVVPGDCYLRLGTDGSVLVESWWRPPTPDMPLTQAAERARLTLRAAVDARIRTGHPVSADLSGGLDSTSLCFLAAEQGVPPVTFRQAAVDPGNQDAQWALRAAVALPDTYHVIVGQDYLPGKYAGLDTHSADPEEPFNWVRSYADLVAIARRVAATGARLHLGGHGGDEIFTAPSSYLHTLIRTHPFEAIRHVRGYQAIRRWPTWAMLRSLADRDDYLCWLYRQADRLTSPSLDRTTPYLSWGPPFRMPPWASKHAVELVRTLVRQSASHAAPLASVRAHHQMLWCATITGRTVRLVNRLFTAVGTRLEAPYLDDRVIEAGLSTELHHHMNPRQYKPLLTTAMAGIVPAPILNRTTKGEFSAETYAGLRRHRTRLLQLMEDCLLAKRGLIDPDVLRTSILATYPTADPLMWLDMTIACEMWLRAEPLAIRSKGSRTTTDHPHFGEMKCH